MSNDIPRAEHPRPQQRRDRWLPLNGPWTYRLTSSPYQYGRTVEEFAAPDSGPFPDEIVVPFAPESRLSGVADTEFHERILYHREVEVPARWRDHHVFIHFGGVDFHTDLYVSGKYAGSHTGGSAPFILDITAFASPGTTIELLVAVQDYIHDANQASGKQSTLGKSHGCYYTRTTGIWQSVWLEAVKPGGVEDFVLLTDPDTGTLTVIPTYLPSTDGAELELKVFNDLEWTNEDNPIASVKATCVNGVPVSVVIPNVRLWWPGDPWLYGLELTVRRSDTTIDSVASYAGIRSVSCRNGRIQINGKSVFQRLVLDQGFYPDGIWTAPDDAALRRDIELSMAAGFNGARLHQKVFEDRFHYWADRLGYITWAEWPTWGLDVNSYDATRAFVTEITETVTALRNHPSIIAWTPWNETWVVENQRTHRLNHTETLKLCRALDPTRPVNSSSGGIHHQTDLYTVHSYESTGRELSESLGTVDDPFRPVTGRPVSSHAPVYEGQPYIVDEFGGIHWGKEDGWGYGKGPASQQEFFERLTELVDALNSHPLVAGWCYTQLTDVEQEQNGVYTYERQQKFPTEEWVTRFATIPPGFDL